jgi:pyruvate dehydrogenase E2 component (dihydrolipoamide acetyltransferase)
MADDLVMPRLSDTMERGTVARWLKQVGDAVHAGDVVAEIETDKATMEYQSDLDGVLLKIVVGDGETAELGATIGVVGEAGEVVADAVAGAEPAAPGAAAAAVPAAGTPAARTATAAAATGPIKASPIARRIAEENGLDLRELSGRGSGPDGRIVRTDVERLIDRAGRREELPPPPSVTRHTPPAAATVVDATRIQTVIARRMVEAKTTVPHFYLTAEVDMARAGEIRRELNAALAADGEKVSVNDLIVRACGLALRDNPQFHRSWIDGKLVYHPHANVGIAVALDDGLIVPVVREVDTKTLRQVALESRDLAGRARAGALKQPEIEGGTFTVSNLGMFGVTHFGAIINPPEPGILAVGATVDRAVPVDGAIVSRPVMNVTLSVDHRASSGADGARLLQSVKRYLEAPILLIG